MLFNRAVLLAKIESVFRTDAGPSASVDALLIGNPEYTLDVNKLTRDNVRSDLSPLATVSGRKTAKLTFTHEVRNNGNTDGSTPPLLGTLLRACGMAQTNISGASGTIGNAAAGVSNTGTISFAKTTAYTGYVPRTVTMTVTTGGASGAIRVTIAAPAVGEVTAYNQTNVAVTNATPITLPGGATVTPTVGTNAVIGDVYTFVLTPAGYQYTPVSDTFESATMYLYRDGLLHKLLGARGTFSVQATGGEFAIFTFTFTGDYSAAIDTSMPTPTYETQKPTQVELANLTVNGFTAFAAAEFTFDMANDVQIREDINSVEAYAGGIITGRAPVLGINPETVLEATHPVWANLAAGTEMAFTAKVGKAKGNVVQFDCPNVQYTDVKYGNRNGILVYDITMNCARLTGNDEVKISFR